MLGIVLTVLKVIGIILLCILLLLLFLVAVVLLVPIRYRARGSFTGGKPRLLVGCSWLLKLIQVYIQYQENSLQLSVKLFGRRIFPKKARPVKEENAPDTGESVPKEESTKPVQQPAGRQEVFTVHEPSAGLPQEAEKAEETAESAAEAKKGKKGKKTEKAKKAKVSGILQKLQRKRELFVHWKELFLTEEMKQALFNLLRKLRALIRHILPRHIDGYLHFGLKDPASTGQLLAKLAVIYPFVGSNLELEPDFERKVLEGDLLVRGRVRLGYLVWLALAVLLDKNIRHQYKLIKAERGNVHG